MKVAWSISAVEDREAIFAYIEAENPRAALEMDNRVLARILALRQFPSAGRPGRLNGTRELVVARTPYIVVYHVSNSGILILRILHGAQKWPEAT